MIREALMGLLAVKPMHGYDLKVSLDRVLGETTKINVGQVYTAINKLEKDGLILAELVVRDERTEMKVYRLAPAGEQELRAWFAAPVEKVDLRDELFIKLNLARRSGLAAVAEIIRTQRSANLAAIMELTALREQYEQQGDEETVLLIEGAILHLEADLRWLDLWEKRR